MSYPQFNLSKASLSLGFNILLRIFEREKNQCPMHKWSNLSRGVFNSFFWKIHKKKKFLKTIFKCFLTSNLLDSSFLHICPFVTRFVIFLENEGVNYVFKFQSTEKNSYFLSCDRNMSHEVKNKCREMTGLINYHHVSCCML